MCRQSRLEVIADGPGRRRKSSRRVDNEIVPSHPSGTFTPPAGIGKDSRHVTARQAPRSFTSTSKEDHPTRKVSPGEEAVGRPLL